MERMTKATLPVSESTQGVTQVFFLRIDLIQQMAEVQNAKFKID